MAHLWVRNKDQWEACELVGKIFDLGVPGQYPVIARETTANGSPAWLIATEARGPWAWGLIASDRAEIRINGQRPPGGLVVLADRDEIRMKGAGPFYFSTEELAAVVSWPGSEREVCCGRCRQPLEAGSPAVRCPGCGIWFHQSEEGLPCWTYSDRCSVCGRSTALDGGFTWVPED